MEYKRAFTDKTGEFPSMSHRGLQNLARNDLKMMLSPLAEYVLRKLKQLTRRGTGIAKYDSLLLDLRACKDKSKEEQSITELEKCEEELEGLTALLAFEGHDDARGMNDIAQYHDECAN